MSVFNHNRRSRGGIKAVALGATLAILSAPTLGYLSYRHEKDRESNLEIVFSEISQMEDIAKQEGNTVPEAAWFYAAMNDLPMKFFESSNSAHGADSSKRYHVFLAKAFSRRLNPDPNDRHRREFPEFFRETPEHALRFLGELQGIRRFATDLSQIERLLGQTWNYHKHEEGHTDYETDSDGNTTSHYDCDYIDYYYDYDSRAGEQASTQLDRLLESFPNFSHLIKPFTLPKIVQKQNEDAIRSTMQHKNELSSIDLLNLALSWYSGSVFRQNMQQIQSQHQRLHGFADGWRGQKGYAHSVHHRSHACISDLNPPEGYTLANAGVPLCGQTRENIDEIISGAEYARANIPILERKVSEYVNIVLYRSGGSDFGDFDVKKADKLSSEIFTIVHQLYKKNIRSDIDFEGFRGLAVATFFLIGLLGPGALGAGIGHMLDVRDERRKYQRHY